MKIIDWKEAWQAGLDVLKPDKKTLEHGLELHDRSFVWDAYGFAPNGPGALDLAYMENLVRSGALRDEFVQTYEKVAKLDSLDDPEIFALVREMWRRSGVNCLFQNAGEESNSVDTMMFRLGLYTALPDRYPDLFARGVFPGAVERAFRDGRRAVCLTTNGVPLPPKMDSLEHALSYIEVFEQLGVRMMHLTYNRSNLIAGGCAEKNAPGLTWFGRDVVREMNRVGIIPDGAHSSNQTVIDAAEVSSKPVVISHSVAAALSTHYRAKSDDAIRAAAQSGGYIGICAHPPFYQGSGYLDAFLDHVEYVAGKFGSDAVAIGTDRGNPVAVTEHDVAFKQRDIFENFWAPQPKNFTVKPEHFLSSAWSNWPLYTVGLVQRGFRDEDIQKIIGGNVMRVFKATVRRNGK